MSLGKGGLLVRRTVTDKATCSPYRVTFWETFLSPDTSVVYLEMTIS